MTGNVATTNSIMGKEEILERTSVFDPKTAGSKIGSIDQSKQVGLAPLEASTQSLNVPIVQEIG